MTLPLNWLDRYFVSAFVVDDRGVAQLTAVETATAGDALVTIRGSYGSVATPNSSVVTVDLPWTVGAAEVWGVDAIVTAKSATAGIRRKIKISGIVWGNGATATLDASPELDTKGTGAATATLTVSGSTMRLEFTPGASTPLTWGFEIRGQQL